MEEKETRRKFNKEFELGVIGQCYQQENIKELAHELGIRLDLIYRWQVGYKEAAAENFPENGCQSNHPNRPN